MFLQDGKCRNLHAKLSTREYVILVDVVVLNLTIFGQLLKRYVTRVRDLRYPSILTIPVFNFGYQMLKPLYPTWIPINLCLNTNIYHNISKTLA